MGSTIVEAGSAARDVFAASYRYVEPPFLGGMERAKLLRAIIPRLAERAEDIVRAACQAKGIDFESPVAGEEMMHVALMIRNARLLAESLEHVEDEHPAVPRKSLRRRADGSWELPVFPTSGIDAFLFRGFRGTVRTLPYKDSNKGPHLVKPTLHPTTCLVLGAGNVSSIPLMDVFSKLFMEGKCCVLKMNPANEWLGPHLEYACRPVIDLGFLRIVYGGADVGEHLCHHPQIHEVHLTGSEATHDAIVWGPPGPERDARKAADTPLLDKPITSELGNVSPIIVVPGLYTRRELRFIAKNIATMLVNNAGFNCNAARVIVTAKQWNLRKVFLEALREELDGAATRLAYYPGARERFKRFTADRDGELFLGRTEPGVQGHLPWTLYEGLNPASGDPLFSNETFCGIVAETAINVPSQVAFLQHATDFANDRLHGTLNATIVIDRHSEKHPAIAYELELAIDRLRYGTVAINHWGALGYAFVSTPWGGYPGADIHDPQSGIGTVHNTYRIAHVEKSVIRGPLTVSPMPPWFHDNPNAYHVARRLVDLEAKPSWRRAFAVALAALGR